MAFMFIAMMALTILNSVLLIMVVKEQKDFYKNGPAFKLELQYLRNKLDCLDSIEHMILKQVKTLDMLPDIRKHCDTMMDIERAKTKAISSMRDEIKEEHKGICAGIEDRYNMIYEEFKDIREMMVNGGHLPKGPSPTADEKETKRNELIQKAKLLKQAGSSVGFIAAELGISETTVRKYLKMVPGLISPDEEDHLGMPQIDDPAAYHKYVDRVVDGKLNTEAVNGKTVTACPFDATHGECETACSDACHDCIVSARAFNLLD